MRSFDMHTHILPHIDDGAKTLEDSILLVNELSSQGVTDIALTPHYYTHRESMEDFLSKRKKSFEEFSKEKFEHINFYLGAEVFFTEYIFNVDTLLPVCYNGTNYMLTEFSYKCDFGEKTLDNINRLKGKYGIIPVITHIERYDALLKNADTIEELRDLGCLMQINLKSLRKFSVKRRIFKHIKNDMIDIVGTDTHSLNRGLFYSEGMDIINKKFGSEICEQLNQNALNILNA